MSQIHLPQGFAQVNSLGPVTAVYRESVPDLRRKFLNWFLTTAILAVITAVGYFGEDAFRSNGWEMVGVAALMLGMYGLVIVGGVWLFVLLATCLLNLVLFSRPQVVVVYRDGIANWNQGKLTACEWSDIREVYEYAFHDNVLSNTGVGVRFDIVLRDGSIFSISHLLVGWERVMQTVRHHVSARLSSEAGIALKAGKPISFGKNIVVENDGVRVARSLLAWDKLSDHQIENGQLVLQAADSSPQKVPLHAIPNLEVLCAILGKRAMLASVS